MATINTLIIPIDPEQVLIVATGGVGRERKEYRDGQATGQALQRDGAAIWRLTGIGVSVAGQGLDGATIETATPLEDVPSGTVFVAAGTCELTIRATGVAGFGQNPTPRGQLETTVWIETLNPVGSVNDLLVGTRRGSSKGSDVSNTKAAS